eukprot:80804-Alexandrium_andersonii.AAC.1
MNTWRTTQGLESQDPFACLCLSPRERSSWLDIHFAMKDWKNPRKCLWQRTKAGILAGRRRGFEKLDLPAYNDD